MTKLIYKFLENLDKSDFYWREVVLDNFIYYRIYRFATDQKYTLDLGMIARVGSSSYQEMVYTPIGELSTAKPDKFAVTITSSLSTSTIVEQEFL